MLLYTGACEAEAVHNRLFDADGVSRALPERHGARRIRARLENVKFREPNGTFDCCIMLKGIACAILARYYSQ